MYKILIQFIISLLDMLHVTKLRDNMSV